MTVSPGAAQQAPAAGNDCRAEAPRGAGWAVAAGRARQLAWLSLAWMTVEGVLGLLAGYRSGSSSLVGWAFGSVIEGLASAAVIWRFTGARAQSAVSERRAQQVVAVSFWVLAPYIAVLAASELVAGRPPATSLLGVAVTATSLVAMPVLGIAKHRLGGRLGSAATTGEGTQNYLCAAQAAGVLAALAVTAAAPGAWPLDPAVALAVAAWSVREGVQAWRGEDCC